MKTSFTLFLILVTTACASLNPSAAPHASLREAIEHRRLDDAQTLLKRYPRQISASDALIAAVSAGDTKQ
jgi:hypothetical protein